MYLPMFTIVGAIPKRCNSVYGQKRKKQIKLNNTKTIMGPFFKVAFTLFGIITASSIFAQSEQMVTVKGGIYIPLYGVDSTAVTVDEFTMDVYPVTNKEYLEFVQEYPEWKKVRSNDYLQTEII